MNFTLGDKILFFIWFDIFLSHWKKIALVIALVIAAAWLMSGCSDGGNVVSNSDSVAHVDGSGVDGGQAIDDSPDTATMPIDMGGGGDSDKPDPGTFRAPCKHNDECDSGLCVPSRDGKICTQTCVQDCPNDFVCLIYGSGTDKASYCFPKFVSLCNPCHENADCNPSGAAGNICTSRGDSGSFCMTPCTPGNANMGDTQGDCPAGYNCDAGSGGTFCVPKADECSCSQIAIQESLSTECKVNACTGTRKCDTGGLTKCFAKVADEICNGVDDDCDGKTDEDGDLLCDDGKECTDDSCPAGICVHADSAEKPCDDGNVCTDGFCNHGQCKSGNKTNCDDNNPCTDDTCDAKKGCVHSGKFTGYCADDKNPCTDDVCKDGACVHPGNSKNCDDNNVCTLNDWCDSTFATCSKAKGALNCNDQNQCTIDWCDPKKGCSHGPASEGGKCTSTSGGSGKCQSGKCV